jgi:hypothetical protein
LPFVDLAIVVMVMRMRGGHEFMNATRRWSQDVATAKKQHFEFVMMMTMTV